MTERIVVAGAGIGGLCAALALIRRGFEVVICEQAAELREVGAGVQLSPNGTRVLAALGVLDDLRAVAVEAEAKEIRLWNSGETWPCRSGRSFGLLRSRRTRIIFSEPLPSLRRRAVQAMARSNWPNMPKAWSYGIKRPGAN